VISKSIVTPLAVLLITPVLVSPILRSALPDLVTYLPHEAALSLVGMAGDPSAAPDRTGGLLVLTFWAVLSIGTAWTIFTRRDS
jgi:hypothetical protein